MIRPFNFFRGMVGTRVVSVQHILDGLNEVPEPPFGISRRHWHMVPQDLRGGERDDMILYIEGWEACISSNLHTNPYFGINNPEVIQRRELWNRGYMACMNRRTRTYTQSDRGYYHTEGFLFFDVSEVRYSVVDRLPYKVMLFRSIEEGNTVEGQQIHPNHPMYYYPDVI